MKPKYRWLLFDLDDTLLDYGKSEAHALTEAFKQYKVPLSQEYIGDYRTINAGLWGKLEKGLISPEELRVERFRRLFDRYSFKVNPQAFGEVYLRHFAEVAFFVDGAPELLEFLSSRFRLAIITNGFKYTQHRRIEKAGIEHYFKCIIISDEIEARKPTSEFFDRAMEKMGCNQTEEILIIGDSLSSDILGGNNAGIDTCWFNPNGRSPDGQACPTYQIQGLSELCTILE